MVIGDRAPASTRRRRSGQSAVECADAAGAVNGRDRLESEADTELRSGTMVRDSSATHRAIRTLVHDQRARHRLGRAITHRLVARTAEPRGHAPGSRTLFQGIPPGDVRPDACKRMGRRESRRSWSSMISAAPGACCATCRATRRRRDCRGRGLAEAQQAVDKQAPDLTGGYHLSDAPTDRGGLQLVRWLHNGNGTPVVMVTSSTELSGSAQRATLAGIMCQDELSRP
jgi:hypothetical protein